MCPHDGRDTLQDAYEEALDLAVYLGKLLMERGGGMENSYIEMQREEIVAQYKSNPTGCGGSFGELLCWEIHSNNQTFTRLAKKWGISLADLGSLISDHCKRLQEMPKVTHDRNR
jgi:hypothetical protein